MLDFIMNKATVRKMKISKIKRWLTEAIKNGGFHRKFEQQTHAPAFVLVDSEEPRTPPLAIASERWL